MNRPNNNLMFKIILLCCLLLSIPTPKPSSASYYDVSWNWLPSLPETFQPGSVDIGLNRNSQEIVLVIYDTKKGSFVNLWIYDIQAKMWNYQGISRSTEDVFKLNSLFLYLTFNTLNDKFYAFGYDGQIYELNRSEDGNYITNFVSILNTTEFRLRTVGFVYNNLQNQLIFLNSQQPNNEFLIIKIYDFDLLEWLEIDEPIFEFVYRGDYGSFVFDPINNQVMYRPLSYRSIDPLNYTLLFDLSSNIWITQESKNIPMDIDLMPFVFHSGIKKYVGIGGRTISGGVETKDIWIYDPVFNEWDYDNGLHENLTRLNPLTVYNPLDQQIYVFGGGKNGKNLFDFFSFSLDGTGLGETLDIDDQAQFAIPVVLLIIIVFIGLIIKRNNHNYYNSDG